MSQPKRTISQHIKSAGQKSTGRDKPRKRSKTDHSKKALERLAKMAPRNDISKDYDIVWKVETLQLKDEEEQEDDEWEFIERDMPHKDDKAGHTCEFVPGIRKNLYLCGEECKLHNKEYKSEATSEHVGKATKGGDGAENNEHFQVIFHVADMDKKMSK